MTILRIATIAIVTAATAATAAFAADVAKSDVEIWNEGVDAYRKGDVTNALVILKPLTLSKTHGARAAEVVAKLEYDRGELEAAAAAAQIALRAAPDDARVNRNFTRAVDDLPKTRETKRVNAIIKAAEGKDPLSLLEGSMRDMRAIFKESATYRTNAPARRVELADSLSARAAKAADNWIVMRRFLQSAVTNEEQAATMQMQIDAAEKKTREAAQALGDLADGAYEAASQSEHDFTRFFKLTAMPPSSIAEDLVAQSNAWLDVEEFNGRAWQSDALEYTRVFRAKFPAWAKAYEQQAQADTNKPAFTAEAQSEISALATQLEKIQIECTEKNLPPKQKEAIEIITKIRELLPKDGGGSGGSGNPQGQSGGEKNENKKPDDQKDKKEDQKNDLGDQRQDQNPEENKSEEEKPSGGENKAEEKDDKEIEALLKKAQERNDEHEADKKARMRKAPLPPNERDW